jgi:hypothetical protein
VLQIILDIGELKEFCNKAVCPHVKEVMLALITKLMHEFAAIRAYI